MTSTADNQAAPQGGEKRTSGRFWFAASLLICIAAFDCQLLNAFTHGPLDDFDSAGHVLNVHAMHEGKLPDPNVWSGFHPPLFHAIGAALWSLTPSAVGLHVMLRLISITAIALLVTILWRALRKFMPSADAGIVTTLLYCTPAVSLDVCMLGNEALCALLITAVLARLLDLGREGPPTQTHAALTGLLAALAAATKATGWVAVGAAVLAYAHAHRRDRPRAALAIGLLLGCSLLIAAPHYVRIAKAGDGSLGSALFAGATVDGDLRAVAEIQPPGERHLRDYLTVPVETFTSPDFRIESLQRSVPGLLYASAWAGAQTPHLKRTEDVAMEGDRLKAVKTTLSLLGILPTLLFFFGLVTVVRRRDLFRRAFLPLLVLGLLSLSFLRYTWNFPIYTTVKSSFLVSALLPVGILLGTGLACLPNAGRSLLRCALLATAAFQVGAGWNGWWSDWWSHGLTTPPNITRYWKDTLEREQVRDFVTATPEFLAAFDESIRDQLLKPPEELEAPEASLDGPASTVERYFSDRVRDPIRSLELLSSDFHQTHGLRVSKLFAGREISSSIPREEARETERAKLAWLCYLQMPWVPDRLSRQEVLILAPRIQGDEATVTTLILGVHHVLFEQTFSLERGASQPEWKIASIEQAHLNDDNFHDARATAPTMDKEPIVVAPADTAEQPPQTDSEES